MSRRARLAQATRRFLSRRQNALAVALIAIYVAAAIAAPALSPQRDPRNPSGFKVAGRARAGQLPQPPSEAALLGTTFEQYDVFHTLVWGTRNALRLGLVVALSTAAIGILIGAASGYIGGRLNSVVMRVVDAFLTFPAVAGVLVFSRVFAQDAPEWMAPPTPIPGLLADVGLNGIMLTLIAFSWMPHARLVNANILRLKSMDFITAARAIGARPGRILFRHLLPHAIAPAIVLAARDVGGMVILDATFAFFRLGGTVEWGQLLADNRDWILGVLGNPFTYWWVFLPATLALILFGVAWHTIGDGLNTLLNPRSGRA